TAKGTPDCKVITPASSKPLKIFPVIPLGFEIEVSERSQLSSHDSDDRHDQFGKLDWLSDMALKTGGKSSITIFSQGVGGNGNRGNITLGMAGPQLANEAISVNFGHGDVRNNYLGRPALNYVESFYCGTCDLDFGVAHRKHPCKHFATVFMIVDDQNLESNQSRL